MKGLSKIASLSLYLTLLQAVIVLAGWYSGNNLAASYNSQYIPMAPITAVGFIIIGIGFFAASGGGAGAGKKRLPLILVALVGFLGLQAVFHHFLNTSFSLEDLLLPDYGRFHSVPRGRMSPLTATLFFFCSLSFIIPSAKKALVFLSDLFNFSIFLVSLSVIVGYIINNPLMYEQKIIPVALPTAICFFLLSVFLIDNNKSAGIMAWLFRSGETQSLLNRYLIPFMAAGSTASFIIDCKAMSSFQNEPIVFWAAMFSISLVFTIFVTVSIGKIIGGKIDAARKEIITSQKWYSTTLRSIGDAVIATDAAGRVKMLNPIAEDLTGWTHDEAEGNTLEEIFIIVNEETRKPVENPVRRVVSEGIIVGLANHTTLISRDGSERPIADSAAPIHDENKQIVGTVLVFRDQTEERRKHEALVKSERLLKTRLELIEYAAGHSIDELLQKSVDIICEAAVSPAGFYHFAQDGRKTLTLHAWSENTVDEFQKPEGKGKSFDVAKNALWADCFSSLRPVARDGDVTHPQQQEPPEVRAPLPRELAVPVVRNGGIVAILGAGGKPAPYTDNDIEFVSFIGDVSWELIERKKADEENIHLQAQLYQSQKMEAVGHLAGGMAHDFNNMLSVIMGAAELAKHEIPEDSPALEELTAINDAVKRARDLTMKLLTFSRREKLDVAGVDIQRIFDNLKGMLVRTVPKNIELKVVAADGIIINCDQNQIQQALVNVCNNAVDVMPQGGRLTVEAAEESFPGGACRECGKILKGRYCLIQISDTGSGMTGETLSKITEPFFTTKGIGKGTGLGLSVTQGIILSHNGHLHIYSEPGKGTCVKFYLPVAEEAARRRAAATAQPSFKGTETILVVDDEEVLLRTTGRLLARNGYNPLLAGGGEQALEIYALRRGEIAAVILDLMMPVMDGSEVSRKLKEINPDVRIVYASGFSAEGVAGNLLKEKHRKFVQKPFDTAALCLAIRELIDSPA